MVSDSALQNNCASRGTVKSVRKALDLLSAVLLDDPAGEGRTLSELADRIAIPRSTAHNLLRTIAASGFIEQTAALTYVAGPRSRQIGRLNRIRALPTKREIVPALCELSAQTGESAVFAAMAGGQRYRVASVDADQAIRVDHALVERCSIYAVPTGRVLVAWADADERGAVIERNGLPGEDWDGIRQRAALDLACERLRREGHCVIASEARALVAMACPVLAPGGRIAGALGCYAPRFRCPPPTRERLLAAMFATASRLGSLLEQEQYNEVEGHHDRSHYH